MEEGYKKAIEKWGTHSQILMAIEEMSELITVLAKHNRNVNSSTITDIIEELVDVEVMLEQLKIIFLDNEQRKRQFEIMKKYKIEYLKRLQEGEK